MNKNVTADTSNPKYEEYKIKFDALRENAIKEHNEWDKRHPNYRGLDNEPSRVDKRLATAIKALQQEYSFLFKVEK